MHIAFITPEYSCGQTVTGGLGNYVSRTARALAERGHDVSIVTFSEKRPQSQIAEGIDVRVVHPAGFSQAVHRLSRGRLTRTGRLLEFSWRAWREIRRLNQERPIDVVQSASFQAGGLFTAIFTRLPHAVRVSSWRPAWHACAETPRDLDLAVAEWLERVQLRTSPHVYAPSQLVARLVAEQGRIARVDVLQTPFYLETTDWDHACYERHLTGAPYVLFVGRMQLHKGCHILAEALPAFLAACPDARAVFAGQDFPSRVGTSLEAYARRCCGPLADRIVFLGPLPHVQLYPVLQGARLVVLPSLIDNLPNALLEAMALERPVIGTVGASFDEVLQEGHDGFLVPPNDPEALARKMAEVWRHPDLPQIGVAARRTVDRFHPDRTVAELLEYFERAVHNRPGTITPKTQLAAAQAGPKS